MSRQIDNKLLTEDYIRGYFEELQEVLEAIENGSEDIWEKIEEAFLEIDSRRAVMGTGGPHVELCFNCCTIEAYWGRERFTWHLNRSQVDPLTDFLRDCEIIA